MRKIVILLVLVAIIATGTAFADYPEDKIGIGALFGYNGSWEGGRGTGNVALSLKLPSLPIFWALSLEIDGSAFGLGAHGDYYFYHNTLFAEANLDWYLGLGGWLSLWGFDDDFGFALGARLPVGLSWQPLDMLEVFLEIAPSLGLQVLPKVKFPAGGIGLGLGVRVWF